MTDDFKEGVINNDTKNVVDTFDNINDATEQAAELQDEDVEYIVRPVKWVDGEYVDQITYQTYSDQTG